MLEQNWRFGTIAVAPVSLDLEVKNYFVFV